MNSEFPSLAELDLIQLWALLIRGEADDQPLAGKVAVACVPVTRLQSRPWRYGRQLADIILKPSAFSCYNDLKWLFSRFWPLTDEALHIAQLAHAGHLSNPAPGATHYYNPRITTPYWLPACDYVATIGDHVFVRERE